MYTSNFAKVTLTDKPSAGDIPKNIFHLLEKAGMKNQLLPLLNAGEIDKVLKIVREEGENLVQEMNAARNHKDAPYAFDGLLITKADDENAAWLVVLQELFMALSRKR